MNFRSILTFLFLLLASNLAAATTVEGAAGGPRSVGKGFVITFNNQVSQGLLNTVRAKFQEAGAFISHDFNLFQGFAIKATEEVMTKFKSSIAANELNLIRIEEDKVVNTNDN